MSLIDNGYNSSYSSSDDESENEISLPQSLIASPLKDSSSSSSAASSVSPSPSSSPLLSSTPLLASTPFMKSPSSSSFYDAKKNGKTSSFVPIHEKFKTKMCSFYYYTGRCQKGDNCNFSHVFREGMEVPLLPTNINYRNEKPLRVKYEGGTHIVPCYYFFKRGFCLKGANCEFSHGLKAAQYDYSPDFRPFFPSDVKKSKKGIRE